MTTLITPVEVDQSARLRGGLLDVARPAPAGWERGGLAFDFHTCREPDVVNKCVALVDEPARPNPSSFPMFPIEQGNTCSTIGGVPQEAHVLDRLDSTTEWALGRQLALDVVGTGAPSLSDATVLGVCGDVISGVSSLLQTAVDRSFGMALVLHATVRGAVYLASSQLITDRGVIKGLNIPVIISPGYPNPGLDTVRFWVTGQVWAGVSSPDVFADVDWQKNNETARAMRLGIVAFDPCVNLAVDVVVGNCLNA